MGVRGKGAPGRSSRPSVGTGGVHEGGAGEVGPIETLSRFQYLKELFLDSATSAAVLSVVPTSPDTNNPLPIAEASETIDTVNNLAATRAVESSTPAHAPAAAHEPAHPHHHRHARHHRHHASPRHPASG